MKVLNDSLELEELEPEEVFFRHIKIVYSIVHRFKSCFNHVLTVEDYVQECALLFFSYTVHKYSTEQAYPIGLHLYIVFKHLLFALTKRRKYFKNILINEYMEENMIAPEKFSADYDVKNFPFAPYLSHRQLDILKLILEGFDYTEINKRLGYWSPKLKDKKGPVFRDMRKIKKILGRFYNVPGYEQFNELYDYKGDLIMF